MSLDVKENVPLAPLTTLELGGAARFFVEAPDEATVLEALAFAEQRGLPTFVLGGGSNIVVPDEGFAGLVICLVTRGHTLRPEAGEVVCEVAAGEPWDDVVAATVAADLAGLECLSGIPGSAGATPIQNVGAYGQEVADSIRSVRVHDRARGAPVDMPAATCAFSYRDSLFKRTPGRYLVLSVTFGLRPGGAPTVRYGELAQALATHPRPSLADTRAAVLALRRRKSMVIDPADPNRRSVGSFFTNPVVDSATADALVATALGAGLASRPEEIPRYPAGPGRVKLAAGWLIEHAGVHKGLRRGPVGVSSAHALALVHHGGGRTRDLLALAREIRATVEATFGLRLVPEPIVLGASPDDPLA